MTTNESEITSADELESELDSVLRAAHDAGVDVEGGWDCRNGDDLPDCDVVVTKVESEVASE
jgi:hypothetical protein